jgi:hypothetical protein
MRTLLVALGAYYIPGVVWLLLLGVPGEVYMACLCVTATKAPSGAPVWQRVLFKIADVLVGLLVLLLAIAVTAPLWPVSVCVHRGAWLEVRRKWERRRDRELFLERASSAERLALEDLLAEGPRQ